MNEFTICIAGNPCVGKSTIFNALTGRNKHTSNWPGTMIPKTEGKFPNGDIIYDLIDLPGSYSLLGTSKEEVITRDSIIYGHPDAVLMVCDATCLERTLGLLLEVLEITGNVIACMNFMDEAKKKNLSVDCSSLQSLLGIPIIPTVAKQLEGLLQVTHSLDHKMLSEKDKPRSITYAEPIEQAIDFLIPYIEDHIPTPYPNRWIARLLIDHDFDVLHTLEENCALSILDDLELQMMLLTIHSTLETSGITEDVYKEFIQAAFAREADSLYKQVVTLLPSKRNYLGERITKLINRNT